MKNMVENIGVKTMLHIARDNLHHFLLIFYALRLEQNVMMILIHGTSTGKELKMKERNHLDEYECEGYSDSIQANFL